MAKTKIEKAKYVDGFLIIVPKKNLQAYKKIATKAMKLWKKHGAVDYYECYGDDLNIKFGLPFAKLTNAKKSDLVIYSFITYKSKSHRNSVNKNVMKDPEMLAMQNIKMPFDPSKMSYGGFKVFVSF